MTNEVSLESLVGEHRLSGVDMGSRKVSGEECNTISFTLDGKTYTATEDPNDGYRSSMGSLIVTKEKCKNNFAPQRVVAHYINGSHDTLEVIDCKTGAVVLRVGTDNSDDYYPSFVAEFTPENMAVNAKVKK